MPKTSLFLEALFFKLLLVQNFEISEHRTQANKFCDFIDPQSSEFFVHFDNNSQDEAVKILTCLPKNIAVSLTNYEKEFDEAKQRLPKSTHLIILQKLNHLRYSKIQRGDVVIFKTDLEGLNYISKQRQLRRSEVLVFVNPQQIFSICFYCRLNRTALILPLARRNFRKKFEVGFINYFPHVYCTNRRKNICKNAIGSEYFLLATLAEKLNFKFRLKEYPTRNYPLAFEKSRKSLQDFGIGGLNFYSDRLHDLQINFMVRLENTVCVYMYRRSFIHDSKTGLKAIFNITNASIGVIAAVILTVFIAFFEKKVNHYLSSNPKIILKVLLKAFIEQPISWKIIPVKSSCLIICSWWMFVMLYNLSYKSQITAFVINPPIDNIENINDLVERGYNLLTDSRYTSDADKVLDMNHLHGKAMIKVVNKVFTDYSLVFYHLFFYCEQIQKISFLSEMRTMASPVQPVLQGWPINQDFPYTEELILKAEWIKQGGFFKFWEQRAVLQELNNFNYHKTMGRKEKIINFGTYIPHFELYLIFTDISIFVFFLELLCKCQIFSK